MTKILKNKYHHQTTDIKHKGIQADHQKKRNSGLQGTHATEYGNWKLFTASSKLEIIQYSLGI